MTMVRDSTNSPLRWRPSPMPVPAPRLWTATDGGRTGITAAANWFLGDNDGAVVMWDPDTGGAFDGLESRRCQSQPGHRVDARPPLDPAARRIIRERLAMSVQTSGLARRSPVHIAADRSRVVTRLFVPGHEGFDEQESRSSAVLQRVLALPDDEVQRSFDDVLARFEGRHHGLTETFLRHADELSDRLDPERQLSPTRRLLLGATFTSEYAIEGAALCNPSMVMHPDQAGVSPGNVRFVMSVRAIGEGHSSSIGFRTGTITESGDVELDPRSDLCHDGTSGHRDARRRGIQRRTPSTSWRRR